MLKCRVCGNDSANRDFDAQEKMFGSGESFRYFECSRCRCLQIEIPPPDLSRHYPEEYFTKREVAMRSSPVRDALKRFRNGYALFGRPTIGKLLCAKYPADGRLESLSRIPLRRDARILDVGCGKGHLLQSLRGLGFKALLGIDRFNAEEIDCGNGLHIRKQDVHQTEGTWDVVMFHHSFEHVPDPDETLRSASRLLSFGGYCLIRVPIVPSYAWEHYGTDWVQLDAPRHLFLHSLESIRVLAAGSSLELTDVVYDSTSFQFWGSEQYARGIPLADPRSHGRNPGDSVFSEAQIEEFEVRAARLNEEGRGDQAAFYLRRSGGTSVV